MEITYQRESFAQAYPEARPLIVRHWEEIDAFKASPVSVDEETYEQADAAGMFRCFTARDAGKLIGYATFFVRPSPHSKSAIHALHDTLYVAPEHRKGSLGIRFMEHCENALRDEGVQLIYQHVTEENDYRPILERRDYKLVEYVYAKRL